MTPSFSEIQTGFLTNLPPAEARISEGKSISRWTDAENILQSSLFPRFWSPVNHQSILEAWQKQKKKHLCKLFITLFFFSLQSRLLQAFDCIPKPNLTNLFVWSNILSIIKNFPLFHFKSEKNFGCKIVQIPTQVPKPFQMLKIYCRKSHACKRLRHYVIQNGSRFVFVFFFGFVRAKLEFFSIKKSDIKKCFFELKYHRTHFPKRSSLKKETKTTASTSRLKIFFLGLWIMF